MQIVPIETLPKQEFSIRLDEQRFVIGIRATGDVMSVSVERNGVKIIDNVRTVANRLVLPYDYMEGNAGNFAFRTEESDLPWWEKFNVTQQLVYVTAIEAEGIRNGLV